MPKNNKYKVILWYEDNCQTFDTLSLNPFVTNKLGIGTILDKKLHHCRIPS